MKELQVHTTVDRVREFGSGTGFRLSFFHSFLFTEATRPEQQTAVAVVAVAVAGDVAATRSACVFGSAGTSRTSSWPGSGRGRGPRR